MRLDEAKVYEIFVLLIGRSDVPTFDLVRQARRLAHDLGLFAPEELAKMKEGNSEAYALFVSFLDELPNRTRNALRAEGINTFADLCRLTKNALLRVPNLGRKSVMELREALANRNLYLKGDEPCV